MTVDEARRLIAAASERWVTDPESAVVWAGEFEGKLGIRMAQESRDFTTLWFDVGQRTVGLEAYLLPPPPHDRAEVHRQALIRNWRSWPVWIATDKNGDLYVLGRIPIESLDEDTLDQAVGATYELVDLAFQPMVRAGFVRAADASAEPDAGNETQREKTR